MSVGVLCIFKDTKELYVGGSGMEKVFSFPVLRS